MTPRAILTAARALIAEPSAWTRHTFARDASGEQVASRNSTACSWCMVGAVYASCAVNDPAGQGALVVLNDALPPAAKDWSLGRFNDDHETTHGDALSLFERAIALAPEAA